jgi:hypothetical protein
MRVFARCSGRGRDHADFELGQIGYLIKEKAMQDKLRNSRQPRGQRRLRSRFNSSQVPRGGAGNVLENARRQYERYVELAQTAASSGDAVEAQNYYQHAEHFFRVMRGQDVEANDFANISDPRWKAGAQMNELAEAQRLLEQIIGHLKAGTRNDTRQAAVKWTRIAAIASTAAIVLQIRQ